MAKRKSMNKRLSRYSRQSAGSAILDPDTNILTEEDSYWWRNLDNNTIARLSVGSDAFNQTSRHLDSNSQVGTSQAADGWWKALEASNKSDKSKTSMNYAEKDAANSTLESESEGEARTAKRKLPFRSEVRRRDGNAFLNALNDSTQTTTVEHGQKSRRKDSMNNAASHSKTITSITEAQKNSFTESHNSTDILKLRPNVLKRNYKTRDKNAFDDILKEDKLRSSSREKSLKIASNDESRIVTEHRVPATIEASTSTQTEPNQFALSFENEHDLSRFPAPKAQSTIIEGGTWPVPDKVDDSNIEDEIVKPRSKLTAHRHKNGKKNLFDNVFEERGTTEKIERSVSINQNATAVNSISEQTLKQSNDSRAQARSSMVVDKYNQKKIHASSMSKRNEHTVESAQNVKESIERKLQEEVSDISTDVNLESRPARKTKSRLLTRSRKNEETNRFQDILEEWNSTDTSESRNVVSVANKSKRSKIDEDSNRHLSKLPDNSNVGNITSTAEIDKKYNKKTKQSIQSSDESELFDVEAMSKKNASALDRQSFLRNTREIVEPEAIKNTSKCKTRNTNSRHGQSVESPQAHDASKSQRARSSRLQNNSWMRSTIESESDETEDTPGKNKRSMNRTKERSDSRAIEKAVEVESPKTHDASKSQRTRSSRLQNNSWMRSTIESESDETEDTPGKNKRSMNRTKERSNSRAIEKAVEVESPKTHDASKSQRTRSSRLQNNSWMRSTIESESDETEDTPRKKKRSMGRTKERADSTVTRPAESSKAENVPSKDQSDRQGTSYKHSHLSMIHKQSDPLISEEDEPAETLDISKRQSDRLSNEQRYSSPENTSRRSTRSLSRTQKRSTLPAPEEIDSTQTRHTPTKPTDRRSKSQNYSRSRITNESESNETESPSRRSNRILSRGRVEQSTLPATRNMKRSGAQSVSQKRSERFTNTQTHLSRPNETELVPERVENATENTPSSARILNTNVQKRQQSIESFFNDKKLPASQAFLDKETVEEIKRELDRVKESAMVRMKNDHNNHEAKPLSLREKLTSKRGVNQKVTLQKQRADKQVDKAFLVNGRVYKAPRLPRPQRWVTDHLYKYLWKRMEPKFKLDTRVASEKFVLQLSNVTKLMIKRKSYAQYKTELHALMKEMARLDIIKTRFDFYNFCHDFFPYELRILTIPMLLPGNIRNIPYDPDKLYEPLLTP